MDRLEALGPRLHDDELLLLAEAVRTGGPVAVTYVSSEGKRTERVLSECRLDPPLLEAWCHLRRDERVFTLSRIHHVGPA
jgi:predicted DNA-binding transcriptional regulator YafY